MLRAALKLKLSRNKIAGGLVMLTTSFGISHSLHSRSSRDPKEGDIQMLPESPQLRDLKEETKTEMVDSKDLPDLELKLSRKSRDPKEGEIQMLPEVPQLRDPGADRKTVMVHFKDLPAHFDWRHHGAVTAVRFQGHSCGSCWSQVTVAATEGKVQIATGELKRLSVQELIDKDENSSGCTHGNPVFAFSYIVKNGLSLDSEYPCIFKKNSNPTPEMTDKKKRTSIDGYAKVILKRNDSDVSLLLQTISRQPVVVTLKVDQRFYDYKATDGLYRMEKGVEGAGEMHGLTAVGFGVEDGEIYLLLKNSWGILWGDFGFMKLALNSETCKKIHVALFPILKQDLSTIDSADGFEIVDSSKITKKLDQLKVGCVNKVDGEVSKLKVAASFLAQKSGNDIPPGSQAVNDKLMHFCASTDGKCTSCCVCDNCLIDASLFSEVVDS